jgi:hypothetical protein
MCEYAHTLLFSNPYGFSTESFTHYLSKRTYVLANCCDAHKRHKHKTAILKCRFIPVSKQTASQCVSKATSLYADMDQNKFFHCCQIMPKPCMSAIRTLVLEKTFFSKTVLCKRRLNFMYLTQRGNSALRARVLMRNNKIQTNLGHF